MAAELKTMLVAQPNSVVKDGSGNGAELYAEHFF
jgi:hypothetical protein